MKADRARHTKAFVADVRFFRSTADRAYWDEMQLDHGFNAPPVWTAGVHALTANLPATMTTARGWPRFRGRWE